MKLPIIVILKTTALGKSISMLKETCAKISNRSSENSNLYIFWNLKSLKNMLRLLLHEVLLTLEKNHEPAVVHIMADDQERFEAEIDLDVSFNEFDEELSEFSEGNCDANVEAAVTNEKQKNTKQHSNTTNFTKDVCELNKDVIPNVTHGNCTDNEKKLAKIEDGEISISSDDESGEKMDFDEGIGVGFNLVQKASKSAEASKETITDNFTFLPPSSVVEKCDKNEPLDEEFMSDTAKRVDETESTNVSMESDNSMDDQFWKRHKRAKLEHGSLETGQEEKNYGKGKEIQKVQLYQK